MCRGRPTGPGASSGQLVVEPIWFQPDLEQPAALLQALGLQEWLRSDSGTFVQLSADGVGGTMLHWAERVRQGLSFEYEGDLEDLVDALVDADFDPAIIDEAYGRSLRVTDPDGLELVVNQKQVDFYGYQRATIPAGTYP